MLLIMCVFPIFKIEKNDPKKIKHSTMQHFVTIDQLNFLAFLSLLLRFLMRLLSMVILIPFLICLYRTQIFSK